MAFPTTSVLDDFNTGASQNLTARAGWGATPFFSSEPTLTTDSAPTYAVGAAGFRSNYWSGTFTNCELWIVLSGTAAGAVTIYVRGGNVNTTTATGYYLDWDTTGGAWSLRYWNGTSSQALSGGNVTGSGTTLNAGDSIGINAVGTTFEAWYRASAGSWTLMGSSTDSTAASGVLAIETSSTQQIDSVGGGVPVAYKLRELALLGASV